MKKENKSNKEKLFSLSTSIRYYWWILIFSYFFLSQILNVLPKVVVGYLLLGLSFFVLVCDIYFKKTLGPTNVPISGKYVILWSMWHFLIILILGLAIIYKYFTT